MKRLSVAVRMLAALCLAVSMLAALAVTTGAAPNPSGGLPAEWDGESLPFFTGRENEVYFPAVGNADESAGLGAAQTSITVQNLAVDDTYLFVLVGMPEDDDGVDLDNWDLVEYAYLSGGAAKTFQASDLEIPAGEVLPVAVLAFDELVDEEGELGNIAGVAKQAVAGESLPYTSAADSAVSGYNAIGGLELGIFDQLYFPIVQTNCGPGGCWNSILRIANMGADDNAAVTVRFFPADDGSGSLQTGFQLQGMVDVGETWSIDLSEWVPAGWVGSAHVYTDDAVGAIVDRVKVGTDMWITNSASNATAESDYQVPVSGGSDAYPYVLFAPDVRDDYNGWNTGINVANTVDGETDVTIQYRGANGNAPTAQTRRLAAHGMTYFYNPSDPSEDRCEQPASDVPGCEFIGGAIILSSNPVAVAVDGVKYFGNDANVGQAFSYSATGNAYDTLSAALVQKGSPASGMGATSGINILNPNGEAATVEATWLNPSGFEAENFGSSIVWVPGFSTGFVYTMFHHNLPNGYVGSVIVDSTLPIFATTANVDYQVAGDGTAIFNLSNPCGFFRQAGECVWASPLEPGATNATLTKEVVVADPFDFDEEDDTDPLAGALVTYTGEDDNGFAVSGSGITGANGTVTFAVPAGEYDITVDADAPAGYVYGGELSDVGVEVEANGATTITNTLTLEIAEGTGTLTKILENTGDYVSMESEVYFCNIAVGSVDACIAEGAVTGGYGENGMATNTVSADVATGQYAICTAVTVTYINDATLSTPLWCEFTIEDADGNVQPILVLDGETTTVYNDFNAQTQGQLDVNVRDDEDDTPIEGATVCFFDADGELLACGASGSAGHVGFVVPAGTYTVNVQADGYEQESTVVEYAPVADAEDGDMAELGPDADVVVALDPEAGDVAILDVFVSYFVPVADGTVVTVYAGTEDDDIGYGGACAGAIVASGTTTGGHVAITVAPGAYCVAATIGQTATESVIIAAGDPLDGIAMADVLLSL